MSNIQSGQGYEQNMHHYVYADLVHTQSGIITIGWPIAGAVISAIGVSIWEGFNGTGRALDIGFRDKPDESDDTDAFLDGQAVVAALASLAAPAIGLTQLYFPSGGELVADLKLGSGDASSRTTGKARVAVYYTVPNNNPE